MKLVLLILGISFLALGGPMTALFMSNFDEFGPMAFIPLIFVILGLMFLIIVFVMWYKDHSVKKNGTVYKAKIYRYIENTSYTVNGAYPMNVVERYVDRSNHPQEAIIPTAFAAGSMAYPIGMTMDIYEYNGKFSWDPKSVRDEKLPNEDALMSEKPVAVSQLHMIAVTCPSCGASFNAATGYSEKCPYCGNYINA